MAWPLSVGTHLVPLSASRSAGVVAVVVPGVLDVVACVFRAHAAHPAVDSGRTAVQVVLVAGQGGRLVQLVQHVLGQRDVVLLLLSGCSSPFVRQLKLN